MESEASGMQRVSFPEILIDSKLNLALSRILQSRGCSNCHGQDTDIPKLERNGTRSVKGSLFKVQRVLENFLLARLPWYRVALFESARLVRGIKQMISKIVAYAEVAVTFSCVRDRGGMVFLVAV